MSALECVGLLYFAVGTIVAAVALTTALVYEHRKFDPSEVLVGLALILLFWPFALFAELRK